MQDLQGRSYAKVSEVKEGSYLEVDGDFTSMGKGTQLVVRKNHAGDGGLYVECAEGTHYLDSQLSDDGTYYIGMYLINV